MRRRLTACLFLLALAAVSAAPLGAAGYRLFKSGPIQITADGIWVWVADTGTDNVYRFDTRDDSVTEFPLDAVVRDNPLGLSAMEDGSRVWVAAHDSDTIYVLDGASGAIQREIPMPWGSGPTSVALSRPEPGSGLQRWALVTLHRAEALAAIDTQTYEIRIIEHVHVTPMGIAWTENEEAAWVTHLMVIGEHPKLTRVDFSTGEPVVTTRLEIGRANPINPVNNEPGEGGYLNWRGHPAQIPSGPSGVRELWLPTQYANMNGSTPTIDSTVQSSLRKLDLTTRTVSPDDKIVLSAKEVHDPVANGNPWLGYGWDAGVSGPVDVGFVDVAGTLYGAVLHEQSNDLVVFPWDAQPWRSQSNPGAPGLPELPVGDRPMGIAVSPVSDEAWVYNALSSDVTVLDLGAPGSARTIPFPTQVNAGDPLIRGARLFHTSDDDRISVNRKVACASCHINAEHDGRTWQLENTPAGTAGQGHGPRSTITLRDVGLTGQPGLQHPTYGWGQMHHSGDRDEVQDFEHTFVGVNFGGTGFIAPAQRQAELGPPNAGLSPDLDAIAAYVESLGPLPRSPHRDARGGLTEDAIRGATFFMGSDPVNFAADADCSGCHNPDTAFVDFDFHDVGQRRAGSEQELNNRAPAWHVNTLTLVGIWNTPPYDGILSWAEHLVPALVDFGDTSYGRSVLHGQTVGLTRRQLRDLSEFLLSVDGDMAADPLEVRNARDTTPPRITRVEAASPDRITVWFSETVDPGSASNPANYQLQRTDSGAQMSIVSSTWDAVNGDRVDFDLDPPLDIAQAGITYSLQTVGPIYDTADWTSTSGGARNQLDAADPGNTVSFTVTSQFTITMGASGYENVTVTVHDASPVGPGLAGWSHDRVQVNHFNNDRTPGFLRFDWSAPFTQIASTPTWTPASADILDARFSLDAHLGDVQELELRRTLQPWSDPNRCQINGVTLTNSAKCGDWNNNPQGAPTWQSSAHGSNSWNQSGARALGGTGDQVSDYNGQWDLSGQVDAMVTVGELEKPTWFSDPGITAAFRFWFDNPSVDYGYALRLTRTPPAYPVVLFYRWEDDLSEHGPVLQITYQVPETTSAPVREVSGAGSSVRLRVTRVGGNSGQLSLTFEDLGAQADTYNLYEGSIGGAFTSHLARACHATPTSPSVGTLELPHSVLSGNLYFLITASNTRMEGTAGFASNLNERDPLRLTCGSN